MEVEHVENHLSRASTSVAAYRVWLHVVLRRGCDSLCSRGLLNDSQANGKLTTRYGMDSTMKRTFFGGLLIAATLLGVPAAAQTFAPGSQQQFIRNSNDLPLTTTGATVNQDGLPNDLAGRGPDHPDYALRIEALEKAFAEKEAADEKAA